MSTGLSEIELQNLRNAKIGMLGYGAQGQAEAANLKRSGIPFLLGLRPGKSFEQAKLDGFQVSSPDDCVRSSEILLMNLPDQTQAEIYTQLIRPVKTVKWLVFAHGFNTHFEKIRLEENAPSHVLIAPKGAASGLKAYYGTSNALPGILAYKDYRNHSVSEKDKAFIESLAKAIGCHPKALLWSSFKDETVCDLFSEQVLLCGGVSSLLRRSYEVLVENGYQKETAYFETLFELKLIVDLIWNEGISGMRKRISPTARFGDITRGDRIIDESVKEKMKIVLKEIESGQFTREFLEGLDSPEFKRKQTEQESHPIESIGKLLRGQLKDI